MRHGDQSQSYKLNWRVMVSSENRPSGGVTDRKIRHRLIHLPWFCIRRRLQFLAIYNPSLNFIRSWFVHESNLISFVAICFFRNNSFLGHNILFCMERYKCSLHAIIIGNCNHVAKQYCNSSINDDQLLTASFLSELIAIRDQWLNFSNGFFFSNCELSDIITYVCTT
jgi:hypothetical protein